MVHFCNNLIVSLVIMLYYRCFHTHAFSQHLSCRAVSQALHLGLRDTAVNKGNSRPGRARAPMEKANSKQIVNCRCQVGIPTPEKDEAGQGIGCSLLT